MEELEADRSLVGVIAQRSASVIEPTFDDLYNVGTLARVVKVIRINETSYSVVLHGVGRFHIVQSLGLEPYMRAEILRELDESEFPSEELSESAERLRQMTRKALALMSELPRETASILDNVRETGALSDLIASNFPEEFASVAVRQRVLETVDPGPRADLVIKMLSRQLEGLEVKAEISQLVETEMTKNQRSYVLRQQMKAIREELGEDSDEDDDIEELRERLSLADVPDEIRKAANKQLGRLSIMQSQSAEFQVARTYVEWLVDLPWGVSSPDNLDVTEVRRCLDEDHFGLDLVKKRIAEFAAVRKLRADNRSPILLFLGPPGVGKTSLGRSIARATGRRYGRIALGGVRDEAEIRGHRRTYVGALPGRIIQALKKVGTNNPVLVLDEIDKMGSDHRGDPASALLEVLDPAQNNSFTDHYIDLPFDLSKVTFLATANYRGGIPPALLDRLEIIDVPGYTSMEKRSIARHFLIPKQLEEHGLKDSNISITDRAIDRIVESYTRESGVRNLERTVASACRELAVSKAEGNEIDGTEVDENLIESYLGPRIFQPDIAESFLAPGITVGLGVGTGGGELLVVEVSKMSGKGKIHVTGSLGPVLQEAAHTAVSFVRSRSARLHLQDDWIDKIDLHLHIPRARAARDFAGMGAAIFGAVCSLLLDAPCRPDVAVVGELTLRGMVLPVRGVKDMLFCAHRAGIKDILIPSRNRPEVEEAPREVLADLNIRYIQRLDEVLPLLFAPSQPGGSDSSGDLSSDAHP